MKSTSLRRLRSLKRKRTLKRGAAVRSVAPGDWKFLYAAYRGGVFDTDIAYFRQVTGYEEELSQERVRALLDDILSTGEAYMLDAPSKAFSGRDIVPVGLVIGERDGHRLKPTVVWFPWASKRNRLESVVAFINALYKNTLILMYVNYEDDKTDYLMRHIGRYGIVTKCCRVPNYFGEEAGNLWRSTHYGP